MIMGIDHGYYAIKTRHFSFPAGVTAYTHEPYTLKNTLQIGGKYYVCGTGRQPILRDKTVNDNYYILTLAAIAMELRCRGLPAESSVTLAAGRPLARYGRDKKLFTEYLLRNGQPVSFLFEGERYKVKIENVKLFPQGYSAIAIHPELVKDEPSVLLMDIGGWTVDLMRLDNNVPNAATCRSLEEADRALAEGSLTFPVFVKPVRGCGSMGIAAVQDREMLETLYRHSPEGLLIQQLATGEEFGADLYVDRFSRKVVSIFTKKKVRMRAGETEKSLSVRDPELFELIERTVATLPLCGPVDMDLFRIEGKWYVSEINPRFGGGYPHAWHCGVNFPALIAENAMGRENPASIGAYEAGIAMMKYSDEVIRRMEEG